MLSNANMLHLHGWPLNDHGQSTRTTPFRFFCKQLYYKIQLKNLINCIVYYFCIYIIFFLCFNMIRFKNTKLTYWNDVTLLQIIFKDILQVSKVLMFITHEHNVFFSIENLIIIWKNTKIYPHDFYSMTKCGFKCHKLCIIFILKNKEIIHSKISTCANMCCDIKNIA